MSTGIELGTSRTEGRALTNCQSTLAPVRKVALCIWPRSTKALRWEPRKPLGQERESELSKYIDLARAKSEALDNIYSLFKQNIKSCNAKRRRQRRRTGKNNNRSN